MMNALVLNKDWTAMETLQVKQPAAPQKNELLVKVKFSAMDTAFTSIVTKDQFAGYIHDLKSKPLIIGYHFSGAVEATGEGVDERDFKVGQHVFGFLQYEPTQAQGAFAEYIVVPATDCARVPDGMSLSTAAASATEAITALQALRDCGKLTKNQSVLIIGASGGVGSAAVGVARAIGASHITAVCSTRDVEKVQQLLGKNEDGHQHRVVDRSKQDITKAETFEGQKFDVVLDLSNSHSFWQHAMPKWLTPNGTFVLGLPTMEKLLLGWLWPLITKKRFEVVQAQSIKEDLELVGEWIQKGLLTIEVDSVHKASGFASAWERQHDRKKKGRVVVQIEGGW